MKTEWVETDVLCIGGGIVGLMAAIRARELGAKVIVADKANTLRSGAAGMGCDHFFCYIPEVHGPDVNTVIESVRLGREAVNLRDHKMGRVWLEKSFDIVKLWDGWGIPMKYQGKWEFSGHVFPGRTKMGLKYAGQNQKPILTEQALKSGAKIMNRIMVFELLGRTDGVVGALGIDTRGDRLVLFQAKSVILGTGGMRMDQGQTPVIGATGDGRAMAYRLGAELVNIGAFNLGVGLKYYTKAGQGTWIGVYRDPQGNPIGKYVTRPNRNDPGSDMLGESFPQVLAGILESGRGPIYMDCTGALDEDIEYMEYWLRNEGNIGVLQHLKEEGVDLRKNPVEFQVRGGVGAGAIGSNEKAETSVAGLYAAGNEVGGGVSYAAVFGWVAGENAANYAKEAPPPNIDKEEVKMNQMESLVEAFQKRNWGPSWKDANIALKQVIRDYAGSVRSETMLKAGLNHLRRLKDKVYNTMKAGNRWELTRCIEVLNLYDLGELMFLGALKRKESRGFHHRIDYPYTDPLLNNKVLIVKQVNEKPVLEWREPVGGRV